MIQNDYIISNTRAYSSGRKLVIMQEFILMVLDLKLLSERIFSVEMILKLKLEMIRF